VDVLIKKHDGFVTTLAAQEEKVTDLEKLAQALLEQDHYASDKIRSRCQGVVDRLTLVKQSADLRRRRLVESRNYQQFLGSVYEVCNFPFFFFARITVSFFSCINGKIYNWKSIVNCILEKSSTYQYNIEDSNL